ncbi:MAG: DUF1080 domain-containing protein [Chitinophagaceae bacterium]|nr:DUF1080 domain-containing protein [Chitinophagaceae bacterium]
MKKYALYLIGCFMLLAGCDTPDHRSEASQPILLFDVKTHDQWEKTTDNWRWEGDVLIGETTAENEISRSSFFIWNKPVEDFILNISFRISEKGNSGIYYRCERGPEGYDDLLGYQADMDGGNQYTGIVYENFLKRHRKVLAKRGELIRISPQDSVTVFPVAVSEDFNRSLIHDGEWNQYELIVKGALIVQKLNGNLISMVEDQADDRIRNGLFGFQLHQGPPMKVEFKDALYRDLTH